MDCFVIPFVVWLTLTCCLKVKGQVRNLSHIFPGLIQKYSLLPEHFEAIYLFHEYPLHVFNSVQGHNNHQPTIPVHCQSGLMTGRPMQQISSCV